MDEKQLVEWLQKEIEISLREERRWRTERGNETRSSVWWKSRARAFLDIKDRLEDINVSKFLHDEERANFDG